MNNRPDFSWHMYECVHVWRSGGGGHRDASEVLNHKCLHHINTGARWSQETSAVILDQPSRLIWSLFTQGGAEAALSGPGEQHFNPDRNGRVEKDKVEMGGGQEERVDGDGDADTDLDLRGTEGDGFRLNIQEELEYIIKR